MKLNAILFDVDGTLAETEEAHRGAFNQAFAEAGRDWHWSKDDYRELLQVAGGRERLRAFLDSIGEPLPDEDLATLHRRKNVLYARAVTDGAVVARPGVSRLIAAARGAGVRLGIATTTSRANLAALVECLFGSEAMTWFDPVVTAEDVTAKKPDPQVYAIALERLGLPPSDCVAIEDSRNGLEAAMACGIPVVVTRSFYFSRENFAGAALVRDSLEGLPLVDLATLDGLLKAPAR